MAKSEIEKRNQNVEDYLGELKSYFINKIPFFSDELNLILNARSNIRKERLFRFFESFREEMQKISGKPLDSDEITSEEFIDVMEAILTKVQTTKSAYKVERFRNILVKQVVSPIDHQLTLKYAGILDGLTDIQIRILEVSNLHFNKRIQVSQINSLLHANPNRPVEKSETIHIPIGGNEVPTSKIEIGFYFDELLRIGLLEFLTEVPLNLPVEYHATQYIPITFQRHTTIMVDRVVTITQLGHELINFVKSSE